MKRLWMLMVILAVALALGACAGRGQGNTSTAAGTATATEPLTDDPADISPAPAAPTDRQSGGAPTCDNVRCASCPEGQTPALTPPNCCRCVPITEMTTVDCSAVRCAACPEGQHPKLTPPDCCRCVPD